MKYTYTKQYKIQSSTPFAAVIEPALDQDILWLTENFGRSAGPFTSDLRRWMYSDRYNGEIYQRVFYFRHSEDYALFALSCG